MTVRQSAPCILSGRQSAPRLLQSTSCILSGGQSAPCILSGRQSSPRLRNDSQTVSTPPTKWQLRQSAPRLLNDSPTVSTLRTQRHSMCTHILNYNQQPAYSVVDSTQHTQWQNMCTHILNDSQHPAYSVADSLHCPAKAWFCPPLPPKKIVCEVSLRNDNDHC